MTTAAPTATRSRLAVLLLIGSFLIGMIVGKQGFASIAPVFEAGFRGALCIFLLEMGQPTYYAQVDGGGYDDGKRLALTQADYITYNLEHSSFDMTQLREFMRGLVDGGPTPSGHRTPAVIVVTPAVGCDQEQMRARRDGLQQR